MPKMFGFNTRKKFYAKMGLIQWYSGNSHGNNLWKGKNPNHGDLLTAVIVDFPGYVRPIWDKNNPTVSKQKDSVYIMKRH